ncbi:potassium-transporting ATPase subunit KdpC [Nocardioides sp. C4-1]|uniref:potassium-transporting ATPase subunit KdpC n=1 Tax=Nocardioides sp. C4-1 TaxID=3151851 RepID=UPI003263D6FD
MLKEIYALGRYSLAGLRVLIAMTVLLGVVYPLVVTGFAQAVVPWRANGSLLTESGEHTTDVGDAVGSQLIGQLVDDPTLFQPRPSAAGDGYDMLSSYGSNYGPESPDLIAAIKERKAEVAEREGVAESAVPPDAVTASGSGLDPDISPAYAALQVPRVARENGLSEDEVTQMVADATHGRPLGVLGEPTVNVLLLNIAVRAAR